jgi:hypothetical protein
MCSARCHSTTHTLLLHRHDLWYFEDLDMASLHRVVANPDTIVTHDACRARKQALPDFMLVNPRAAGRLIEAAGQVLALSSGTVR